MADELKVITFPELPVHDTMWSITTGKDGKIYMGLCGEMTGGLSVFLVSYDPVTEKREYLLEVAKELKEPPDNGRATHSKIHYSLVPSSDGKLYGATHCTGPPLNHSTWSPWNCWDDSERMFSGFHIFSYDLATGDFEDFGVQAPNEGSRIMALAEKRSLLYGITYPRDHFYVFDIKKHTFKDIGRIGDVNPQSMWMDSDENAYTVDELGYVVKYQADVEELKNTDIRFPSFRDLPCVSIYDCVPSPDGKSIYGVTWGEEKPGFLNHFFRYDFKEKNFCDLGSVDDFKGLTSVNHIGGLVFGDDGYLYFASGNWALRKPELGIGPARFAPTRLPFKGMYLYRMKVETLKRERIGPFMDTKGKTSPYIAHATKDFAGRLYFAETNFRPPRLFIYSPDYVKQDSVTPRWPIVKPWG